MNHKKTHFQTKKNKNRLSLKENQIAKESTYPCFPISQDEPSADNNPIPSNIEFSCIQPSRGKLSMRDDNLVLFIPADCRLTTETGQE